MPIRLIAKDLYRLIKEVDKVREQIETARPEQLEKLKDRLRKLTAERDRMRNILEGSKEKK
ncbi:MAG: hypothetical protein RBR01_04030 [Desulfobacterales bacterium]|mgnify:CR=1 FL=1|nr:hypothetical protein [Desulfobacterales bacterium]MDD3082182.1 hypothetical protein [Desulfobacterales bacterium]MDD3951339.1 hypothetical protein [Desulfobacterales bacterium]MDD4462762.1 hypothetical protein [Desulfobacterales bacterium]MDY0377586.1 hypothetical protein [Desulfobacterales bacterium]